MNKVQPFDWKPPFQDDKTMRSPQRYTSKQLFAVFWPFLETTSWSNRAGNIGAGAYRWRTIGHGARTCLSC